MPRETAQELIEKFKAKYDPEVIAWRWKLTKPLAVRKMEARTSMLAKLEEITRTVQNLHDFTFPQSARLWMMVKDSWDTVLKNKDTGLNLWHKAGLPENAFPDFFDFLKTVRPIKQTITSYCYIR
jgi:hypothetical protein